MNQEQLQPSKNPIHSNMWVGRPPTNREFSDEFANLYRLVAQYKEEVDELTARLEELES